LELPVKTHYSKKDGRMERRKGRSDGKTREKM
jgi:hypothetical protein